MYVQHDILELWDVLSDQLQQQAMGTKLAQIVSQLYHGIYEDYAKCLQCENLRSHKIPYFAIGLDIENVNTLKQAFENYIKPETLDGDNKVNCDICGNKQATKKGLRFIGFPYFLSIHLKRWTFSLISLQRIKVHNKIDFPNIFDASQFIEKNNENNDNESMEYELYSMMLHTGGALGGHYFAYIKDFNNQKWYEFNDSKVIQISQEDINHFFEKNNNDNDNENNNNNNNSNNKNDIQNIMPAPIPTQKQIQS